MTIQSMNSFLNLTGARYLRGTGAQYRYNQMGASILGMEPRVGLRQRGAIDWSALQRQNPYYQQTETTTNSDSNKANWKEGIKQGLSWGASGALAGLPIGGPIGAAVGGGIGLVVGLVKGMFFS